MTLLELVNKVLVRLRVSTVSSADQTTYSAMISQLVNDAKREVEDQHPWAALRTTVTASVIANDTSAPLTGTNKRSRILTEELTSNTGVYNRTTQTWVAPMDRGRIVKYREIANYTPAEPSNWAFKGVNSNGLLEIEIYPDSDGAYTLAADCIVPQDDLTTADALSIPDAPVYLRALMLALTERGDDGGTSAAGVMREYEIALSDAIERDKEMAGMRTSSTWVVP